MIFGIIFVIGCLVLARACVGKGLAGGRDAADWMYLAMFCFVAATVVAVSL